MNCKKGDMAVVVSGGNEGLIVEVQDVSAYYGHPYWRCKTAWPARGTFPNGEIRWVKVGSIHDRRLRPIKPGEETLIRPKDRETEVA